MKSLNDICIELADKPLPEAADWQRYYKVIINCFEKLVVAFKDYEIVVSGKVFYFNP